MAKLGFADIADIANTTRPAWDRQKWTDISRDLQKYIVWNQLMGAHRVDMNGGTPLQWPIMTADTGGFETTGLYDVDNPNVTDQWTYGTVPYRFTRDKFSWDTREVDVNMGPEQIVSILEGRRVGRALSTAEGVEDLFWRGTASDDGQKPFPLPYYITKEVSTAGTTGAFSGNQLWSGTNAAGVNHANWRNWSQQYTNVTDDDLLAAINKGSEQTNFITPAPFPENRDGPMDRGLYTGLTTYLDMKKLMDTRNENLGRDLAYDNVTFNGTPVVRVPRLDEDTDYPVYQIDWSVLQFVFQDGYFWYETPAQEAPFQPLVLVSRWFANYNLKCTDRRRLAVYCKSASF